MKNLTSQDNTPKKMPRGSRSTGCLQVNPPNLRGGGTMEERRDKDG